MVGKKGWCKFCGYIPQLAWFFGLNFILRICLALRTPRGRLLGSAFFFFFLKFVRIISNIHLLFFVTAHLSCVKMHLTIKQFWLLVIYTDLEAVTGGDENIPDLVPGAPIITDLAEDHEGNSLFTVLHSFNFCKPQFNWVFTVIPHV